MTACCLCGWLSSAGDWVAFAGRAAVFWFGFWAMVWAVMFVGGGLLLHYETKRQARERGQ